MRSRQCGRPVGARVVLVDDLPEARELFATCLESSGFRVTAAQDGPSAIAAVHATKPSVVLSDFSMPEMDGGEFAAILKSDPRTSAIPIVMITAMPGAVDAQTRSLLAALVEKPIDPVYLVQILEDVIAQPTKRRSCG